MSEPDSYINKNAFGGMTSKGRSALSGHLYNCLGILGFIFLFMSTRESIAQSKSPEPVKKTEQKYTLKVFNTLDEQAEGRRAFTNYVELHIDSLLIKRKSELNQFKSASEWKARQSEVRKSLQIYFGEFPARTPLNARTTGILEREHYKIEKVIFESQPEYYVTANLYVPKGRNFPLPGVLFTCGHADDAKAYEEYQMTCQGLVSKGYVVLIFDPMGQGERSEYLEAGTGKTLVAMSVDQHHYVSRQSFLTGWTLSGLRTWDAIRALDYLASRDEVDKSKLASVGQSGGGQMALLITAVDERIKVCAASHPGGSMENTYLSGQTLPDREILSLIPPRPLQMTVGNESGEEPWLRERLEDMQLFYQGLGAGKECGEMEIVPGIHSMNRSNRESTYEWLNKWLDKEAEGKAEGVVKPEKAETLFCTESGNTLISLGGETAQTLNSVRADHIYNPDKNPDTLKARIAFRTGLKLPDRGLVINTSTFGSVTREDYTIEKLKYESETGIEIPALLIKPGNLNQSCPIVIFESAYGKPDSIVNNSPAFLFARGGCYVLAIDVRGIGETSPTIPLNLSTLTGYTPSLWQHDVPAIQSLSFGRTTLGMRTFDLLRGIDFIKSRKDLKEKKIVVAGEGLGGLWALLASAYDPRIEGVVTIGSLPSYKLIVKNIYYNAWGYCWVPGVLCDFDIPDIIRLVSPRPQIWIDPVDASGTKLKLSEVLSTIGKVKNIHILTPDNITNGEIPDLFNKIFK